MTSALNGLKFVGTSIPDSPAVGVLAAAAQVRSSITALFAFATAVGTVACREVAPGACLPERGVEVWVERRFPPTVQLADTVFASLSIAITPDSLRRLPTGSMISVIIAGPASAPLPDTVRVLSAELPFGQALWRGDQLRSGQYTAEMTTTGYGAGPHAFSLAPGERVEVEARLHHSATCEPDTAGLDGERDPR